MTYPQPGAAPASPPVCPRHPDRVSYVRCQRCGRPTCPECQRPAAVGVQCVDCVAQANARTPQSRTIFGGTVHQGRPWITLTLIGLCVVSYIVQQIDTGWTVRLVFAPFIGESEPWRFLTAAFLHATSQPLHLLMNMLALWWAGPTLERALGRWRYIALYLMAAVGGSVMYLLMATPGAQSWYQSMVGASGAVFGLFGAILLVMRRVGANVSSILGLLVINAALPFVLPGIAWQAHLGGFVVGAALGAAFGYAPREKQGLVAVASCVGMAVLLVVASVLKYAMAG